MLEEIYHYFEYASLVLAILFYKRYKSYSFYKFFLFYLINLIIFGILGSTVVDVNNYDLFNIYTFFEFNFVALIYYNLIKDKETLKLVKIVIVTFNTIYFSSFFFLALQNYTVTIEGIVNSIFIIFFFRELLNSDKILNYKKLLPFWISVGFLVFYLTSIPFFTLLYFNLFKSRIMFPILYSLIIVFHLCFIYGLVTCKKVKE